MITVRAMQVKDAEQVSELERMIFSQPVSYTHLDVYKRQAVLCAWFLLSQTIERLSHHKLPLAMHYKDRYLWIGLAIRIINCMVKNIVRLFWGISLL